MWRVVVVLNMYTKFLEKILATLLWKKSHEDYFSQKRREGLRTTTTRHMVSFIDFYRHFLANFQT